MISGLRLTGLRDRVVKSWAQIKISFSLQSVPPKLNAFSVDEHLKLGQRVSMLCAAREGDLPMVIRWYRDGSPIITSDSVFGSDTNRGISITEIGDYESVLRIDDLRPEHNANFSCVAENEAGFATHSQQLRVKGNFHNTTIGYRLHHEQHHSSFLNVFCTLLHQIIDPYP